MQNWIIAAAFASALAGGGLTLTIEPSLAKTESKLAFASKKPHQTAPLADPDAKSGARAAACLSA
jgi:hypothetical protein